MKKKELVGIERIKLMAERKQGEKILSLIERKGISREGIRFLLSKEGTEALGELVVSYSVGQCIYEKIVSAYEFSEVFDGLKDFAYSDAVEAFSASYVATSVVTMWYDSYFKSSEELEQTFRELCLEKEHYNQTVFSGYFVVATLKPSLREEYFNCIDGLFSVIMRIFESAGELGRSSFMNKEMASRILCNSGSLFESVDEIVSNFITRQVLYVNAKYKTIERVKMIFEVLDEFEKQEKETYQSVKLTGSMIELLYTALTVEYNADQEIAEATSLYNKYIRDRFMSGFELCSKEGYNIDSIFKCSCSNAVVIFALETDKDVLNNIFNSALDYYGSCLLTAIVRSYHNHNLKINVTEDMSDKSISEYHSSYLALPSKKLTTANEIIEFFEKLYTTLYFNSLPEFSINKYLTEAINISELSDEEYGIFRKYLDGSDMSGYFEYRRIPFKMFEMGRIKTKLGISAATLGAFTDEELIRLLNEFELREADVVEGIAFLVERESVTAKQVYDMIEKHSGVFETRSIRLSDNRKNVNPNKIKDILTFIN